ncbi:MAG: O-sialoglycoprotein endopeptidase, partial [Bacillota bacterium]|nr:O-sialoglycoprotein endopeptidase [Bacillota bacterium]
MKAYIGLDTSCYTASAAAVLEDGRIAADFREALPVPDGTIGLRQSEAVFVHLRTMPALLEAVFQQIRQHEAAAVCASIKPRPVEGSYMPVFIVGKSMARSVAASLGVPYFETTHQEGHIAAGLLGQVEMPEEFLALHVSGGTTEVLQVRQKEAGYDISLLGGTKDISAGQLVDRIGVLIGCRFPAGGEME